MRSKTFKQLIPSRNSKIQNFSRQPAKKSKSQFSPTHPEIQILKWTFIRVHIFPIDSKWKFKNPWLRQAAGIKVKTPFSHISHISHFLLKAQISKWTFLRNTHFWKSIPNGNSKIYDFRRQPTKNLKPLFSPLPLK